MEKNPKFENVLLSNLKLDSYNPRLPKSMHGKTEEEILRYMLLDASLIELMLAIGQNDFFPGEQLLVVKDIDNVYKVIEGNRRLTAVKLLNNPELADVQQSKIQKVLAETFYKPTELPCLIFPTEEGIHNYLGYRHITGIKEWKLLEKARYINGLRNEKYQNSNLDKASRDIAKIIGSRKDYVRKLIIGYDLYKIISDEGFYRIRDLDDTTFYFNYIADSLSKENIRAFLNLDLSQEDPVLRVNLDHLKKWTHWLFEKNDQNRTRLIGDSHDLNTLNLVLGDEDARVAFEEKGYSLERARELTGEIDNQFIAYLKKALDNLENEDRLATRVKVQSIIVEDDLKNLRSLASKIFRTIKEKEDEDEL